MTDTDNLDVLFLATKEFTNGLRLGLNGASRSLLNKDITILTMFESEKYKVYRLFQRHDKTSHRRLSQSYRIAIADLLYPQRNYIAFWTF